MTGRLEISTLALDGDPAGMQELLEAVERLEVELDAEQGVVLRELTELVRRQTEFKRLKDRFSVAT